jgi:hypothetical protein
VGDFNNLPRLARPESLLDERWDVGSKIAVVVGDPYRAALIARLPPVASPSSRGWPLTVTVPSDTSSFDYRSD